MAKLKPIHYCLILNFTGLFFLATSSVTESQNLFGHPYFFIVRQILWSTTGLIAFLLLQKLKPKVATWLITQAYVVLLVFLGLTVFSSLSDSILGAKRWLNLFNLSLQPSELIKLPSIVFFVHLFTSKKPLSPLKFLLHLSLPILLILLQPNLSTAILLSLILLSLYYLCHPNLTSIFILILLFATASSALIISSPYRLKRLQSLIQFQQNTPEIGYHNRQLISAIKRGGLFGVGLGMSESRHNFLPKISTDSIFALIIEETGLAGLTFVICLYLLLINSLQPHHHSPRDFRLELIASAISVWIGFQTAIHLASSAALIPITGIPLPFVSYGGSSMLSLYIAIGYLERLKQTSKHDS